MDALDCQEALPAMIETATAFAGMAVDTPVARRAMARALYFGALVDAGVAAFAAMNAPLGHAMDTDPAPFAGQAPLFVEEIAQFRQFAL